MGNIHKLTKDGVTLFPATTTDAVVHPQIRTALSNLINEYNVSQLYPTSGSNNGDKYTLQSAISLLADKLTDSQKVGGVKIIFIDSFTSEVQEWRFNGTFFTSTSSWSREDYWYSDISEEVIDLENNLLNNVLRKSEQYLTTSEKNQAKTNLGIELDAKTITWNYNSNLNNCINTGIYTIDGYRTNLTDNMPIQDYGESARITAFMVVNSNPDIIGQSITVSSTTVTTKTYKRTYNKLTETWSDWVCNEDKLKELESRLKRLENIILQTNK